jgi:phenylacetate-CoA ligase
VIEAIRILQATLRYQRNARLSPEGLGALQRRKLERLVAHARRASPFFARRYAGVPERGFRLDELPPVSKAEMMTSFDDYCTDRRLRRDAVAAFVLDPGNVGKKYLGHVAIHTSGTGGEPALIVYDARAFAHVKAIALARGGGPPLTGRRVAGALLGGRRRLAVLVMDGGHFPSYSNFVHLPRLHSLFADVRVLSVRRPVAELVEELNAFQPEGIVGYPSTLEALAHEQLAGRLAVLRNAPFGSVVTLSEPLLSTARDAIGGAFEVPVVDFYATGECMHIARSCAHGAALHVSTDMALLEVVDRAGHPVPPGTFGAKVYLTNLENRVQPFIRYEVSDVVAWEEEPCACGSPFPRLKAISGRTDDLLHVEGPDGASETIHPYWLMVPLLGRHEIRDYQVKQVARNVLEISIVGLDARSPRLREIEEALRTSLETSRVGGAVRLHVASVDRIAPDPVTGKARRICSALDHSVSEVAPRAAP